MISEGFTISVCITCRACGRTSFSLEDVRNLYCGSCHDYHARPAGLPDTVTGMSLLTVDQVLAQLRYRS